MRSVSYWDGSDWSAQCPPGDDRMQRVELAAVDSGLGRELIVVKRKAPVAFALGGAWGDGIVTPEPHPDL